MTTLILDDRTANELQAQASACGLTVGEYVKALMNGSTQIAVPRMSSQEIESLLNEHAFDGPSLPPDFSRADIYGEHD